MSESDKRIKNIIEVANTFSKQNNVNSWIFIKKFL